MGQVNRSRAIVVALLALVLAGGLLYTVSPASLEIAPPGEFSTGMAIVILGYLLYPVVALLAVGLLVVALMMLVGASIERRREQSPK